MVECKPSSLTDLFTMMNPTSADSVGYRIRLLRMQKGITQEEFARRVCVSRSAVALWETNRGGEARHLSKIAAVLGVPVESFLNGMMRSETSETVTADEGALLSLYRGCRAANRLALLRTAGRMHKADSKTEPAEVGLPRPVLAALATG